MVFIVVFMVVFAIVDVVVARVVMGSVAPKKTDTYLGFYKTYRKGANSNMSGLEAHDGFFRLLMKGIFLSLCTVTF